MRAATGIHADGKPVASHFRQSHCLSCMCFSTIGCSDTKIARSLSFGFHRSSRLLTSDRSHEIDARSPKELQSFVGLFNFLTLLVNLERLHLHPFQHWLASHWDNTLPSNDLPMSVSPNLMEAIGEWSDTDWIL